MPKCYRQQWYTERISCHLVTDSDESRAPGHCCCTQLVQKGANSTQVSLQKKSWKEHHVKGEVCCETRPEKTCGNTECHARALFMTVGQSNTLKPPFSLSFPKIHTTLRERRRKGKWLPEYALEKSSTSPEEHETRESEIRAICWFPSFPAHTVRGREKSSL